MAHARQQIALLREYRTRLIAGVVTGKLDVRDVAAHLPEEPDDALEDLRGIEEEVLGGAAEDEREEDAP